MHRSDQGVKLQGAFGFKVLKHGGLEGPKFCRDQVSVLGSLFDRQPNGLSNGLGLYHDIRHQGFDQFVAQNVVCGGPR